jgi:hypothetical protein
MDDLSTISICATPFLFPRELLQNKIKIATKKYVANPNQICLGKNS